MAANNGTIIEEVSPQQPDTSLVLMPTMNIQVAMQRLMEFQEFVRGYMVEGEDYGKIPGTPKPTLLKPGADKLCEIYGLSDSYSILAKIEDFDKGLFDYTIECQLVSRRTNQFVSSGLGCCSSWESKYRWRTAKIKCPTCGKEAIIESKPEYGGGWVCFKKKGGCGAKFKYDDPVIAGQNTGKIENPDIIDQKNTILKMAKKRAKIDAVISATRSSGIFTQDMEDLPSNGPRTEEANDLDMAGYDRDEHLKNKIDKLKEKEEPKTPEGTWREIIKNCSTVTGFNTAVQLIKDLPKDFKLTALKILVDRADAVGFSYDKSRFAFFDAKEKLQRELEASLADVPQDPETERSLSSSSAKSGPTPRTPPERPSKRPGVPSGDNGLKLVTKGQEIRIHEAREGIDDIPYHRVLGRYGAEHARDVQKINLEAVIQDLADLKKM